MATAENNLRKDGQDTHILKHEPLAVTEEGKAAGLASHMPGQVTAATEQPAGIITAAGERRWAEGATIPANRLFGGPLDIPSGFLPHPNGVPLGVEGGGCVFPSTVESVRAIVTEDRFQGAHDYIFRLMKGFENGQAVYEEGFALYLSFTKKNLDGTWQHGLQSEQLLLALLDRHRKLNDVFPAEEFGEFERGITIAITALESRVRERQARGVFGEQKK